MTELLPCPFCSGKPSVTFGGDSITDEYDIVQCHNCDFYVLRMTWNTRTELKDQLADSERRYGELSNAFDNLLKYKNEMQKQLAKAEEHIEQLEAHIDGKTGDKTCSLRDVTEDLTDGCFDGSGAYKCIQCGRFHESISDTAGSEGHGGEDA